MNADRTCPQAVVDRPPLVCALNRFPQPVQGGQRLIEGRRDRGWQVTGDAMAQEELLQDWKCPSGLHDVVPGPAVDMHVEEAWYQHSSPEIDHRRAGGQLAFRARSDTGDHSV